MATNQVHIHGTDRLKVLAFANHLAGDLVYEKGFWGVVQDNVTAGSFFTLILNGTWNLPRVPSTVSMGVKVWSPPSSVATTLEIAISALAGYTAIGRTIATGTATTAKIQLFNPNQS